MKPIPTEMLAFSRALETQKHWTYFQAHDAIHDAIAGRNDHVWSMWQGWKLCFDNAPIHDE